MDNTHKTIYGSLSIFSCIVCGVAICVTYAVPKQRIFPNVILIWICISDFLFALFLSIKWIPGPLFGALNSPDGTGLCILNLYFIILLDIQSCVISLLISYTLYAAIVNQVSLEHLNQYKFWYGGAVVLVSVLFPFVVFVEINDPPSSPVCAMTRAHSISFRVAPWVLLFLIQLRYTFPVLKYVSVIKSTFKTYSLSTSSSRVQFWLYLRFLGIIIARFLFKLVTCLYYVLIIYGHPISPAVEDLMACSPILLSVNAMVVIAGNALVRNTANNIWIKLHKTNKLQETISPVSSMSGV